MNGKQNQGLRWFYSYTGSAPTSANLAAFGTLIGTQIASNLQHLYIAENVCTGLTLEDLSSSTGAVGEVPLDLVGEDTGNPLPAATAFVTSYQINRRYRGGHPRSYWPVGDSTSLTNEDTWSTTFVGEMQTAVPAVINAPVAASEGSTTISAHVNVSYYDGFTSVENPITHRYRNVPTLRATPVVDNVVGILAQSYVGSMRRRRPKTSA